jgi:hypothetical protein
VWCRQEDRGIGLQDPELPERQPIKVGFDAAGERTLSLMA